MLASPASVLFLVPPEVVAQRINKITRLLIGTGHTALPTVPSGPALFISLHHENSMRPIYPCYKIRILYVSARQVFGFTCEKKNGKDWTGLYRCAPAFCCDFITVSNGMLYHTRDYDTCTLQPNPCLCNKRQLSNI